MPDFLPTNGQKFLLRFDGSCPRNPGPMGIGYVIFNLSAPVEGQGLMSPAGVPVINSTAGDHHSPYPTLPSPLVSVGAQVGEGTNNIAEYHALIAGLRHALRLGLWDLEIESDSLLVVMQVLGKFKVRDSFLKRLHAETSALMSLFRRWSIKHIRREENDAADALSRDIRFEEPSLPPPGPTGFPGVQRSFLSWQAAFVRHHWRAGIRNSYLFGRVFDAAPTSVEAIGNGESYKDATLSDLPYYGPRGDVQMTDLRVLEALVMLTPPVGP